MFATLALAAAFTLLVPTFNSLNSEHFAANTPPISLPPPPNPPSHLPDLKLDSSEKHDGPAPPPCNMTVDQKQVYHQLVNPSGPTDSTPFHTNVTVPPDAAGLAVITNLSQWNGDFHLTVSNEKVQDIDKYDVSLVPANPLAPNPQQDYPPKVFEYRAGEKLIPGQWAVSFYFQNVVTGTGNVDILLETPKCAPPSAGA
ncbi:MAG: hypothetical protein ACYDCK_08270 [Thermoplasmatota archaeon]